MSSTFGAAPGKQRMWLNLGHLRLGRPYSGIGPDPVALTNSRHQTECMVVRTDMFGCADVLTTAGSGQVLLSPFMLAVLG